MKALRVEKMSEPLGGEATMGRKRTFIGQGCETLAEGGFKVS